MSMYLNFEPHSWYMGFAVRKVEWVGAASFKKHVRWEAYTDDGNTYRVIKLEAPTLTELKQQIRDYWRRDNYKHCPARLFGTLTRTSLTDSGRR